MKTTPPKRKPNKHYRSREYLTPSEVRSLLNATLSRPSRYAERDFLLMLMMFRHGLRVGEAVGEKYGLRWDAVMWGEGQIFITREKGSDSGVHPLREDELVHLKKLREQFPESKYIFVSERGEVMKTDAVRKLIGRVAAEAGLDIKVHCHMMRHACGYFLVNRGYNTREIQDFLGHRDIKHTEKYTKLNAQRFMNFDWGDL
ncbi:tyrosine-type recombinase/integrase [Nostoc sp. UCD121]|uniref:tyrosine-type recombinase/integrase n=1 Tax=unclassified Nostoc TaxID=2593658 RepID=UPI0016291E68|nr:MULTISPECIES: tyrosine-type recombinase/integrase [unclassified Nostoc]MBC1225002.1 tyrosine-type recombinase/integrase [Nostoc sp. UCD120]MBC1280809.1 tyrosine-type recombinase/integrase [Nostoc sp. UCD121]